MIKRLWRKLFPRPKEIIRRGDLIKYRVAGSTIEREGHILDIVGETSETMAFVSIAIGSTIWDHKPTELIILERTNQVDWRSPVPELDLRKCQ